MTSLGPWLNNDVIPKKTIGRWAYQRGAKRDFVLWPFSCIWYFQMKMTRDDFASFWGTDEIKLEISLKWEYGDTYFSLLTLPQRGGSYTAPPRGKRNTPNLSPSQGIFLLPNWICVLFLSDLSAPPGTASSAPPSDKFASKTCCFGFSAGSLDYWPKATFFNQFSQEYSFDAISVSCLLFIS